MRIAVFTNLTAMLDREQHRRAHLARVKREKEEQVQTQSRIMSRGETL